MSEIKASYVENKIELVAASKTNRKVIVVENNEFFHKCVKELKGNIFCKVMFYISSFLALVGIIISFAYSINIYVIIGILFCLAILSYFGNDLREYKIKIEKENKRVILYKIHGVNKYNKDEDSIIF